MCVWGLLGGGGSALCPAEGTRVVPAGLQPCLDAVFVDVVGAVQRVAALAVHQVLAHQAEFPRPAGVAPPSWLVHGSRWSLDLTMGHRSADGARRGLAPCRQQLDLLGGFFDGHARQRAAGALHLLEQGLQLGGVVLREAGPQLL